MALSEAEPASGPATPRDTPEPPPPQEAASQSCTAAVLREDAPAGGEASEADTRDTPEPPPQEAASQSCTAAVLREDASEADASPMDAPLLGSRIEVYWPDDGAYYAAEVLSFDDDTLHHKLRYELDNEEEAIDLLQEEWRPAPFVGSEIELLSAYNTTTGAEGREDGSSIPPRRAEVRVFHEPSACHLLRFTDEGVDEYVDLRFCMWQPTGKWYYSRNQSRPAAAKTPPGGDGQAGPAQLLLQYAGGRSSAPSIRVDANPHGALLVSGASSGQTPVEVPLGSLVEFVCKHGGSRESLNGWRCLRYERGVAGGARKGASGSHYVTFVAPNGDKYRSKKEVGRALGLQMETPLDPNSAAAEMHVADAKRRHEADLIERGEVLCCKVAERDGGAFGCTLRAYHQGPHQLEEPTKRPRPAFMPE